MNPIIRKLFYAMPVGLRYTARRLLYLPSDLFRNKNSLVPPKGLIFTGRGDYVASGNEMFGRFRQYTNITPKSSILDIGSGIGRMAVPFTKFLDKDGKYEGFDIVKMGVDWCQKNITSRFPNFNFTLIPLKNDLYNLSTDEKASTVVFPYPDNTFDLIFLTSVFTHMLPEDMEHYINEIKRVLKPGQTCFATFFLLDSDSENAMNTNAASGRKIFTHHFETYSLMDKNVKEANVAYRKDYIFGLLRSQGLEISHFFRGSWSGMSAGEINEHQDVIIFKKA